MNCKEIREKIGKIEWYQQGAAVKPLYISYPWHACSLMKIFGKKIPPKYELFVYIKNDFMDDYISKRSLESGGRYYYERQKRDKKFISKLINNWHKKYVNPYLNLNKKTFGQDLSKYSDAELLALFKKFTDIYLAVWYEAIFLDSFDYFGEEILRKAMDREKKNIDGSDLEILLTPPGPSFLQKERMDLLKLAEIMLKKNISEDGRNKYLRSIVANYYWLQNDFAKVHYLDQRHFLKKIKEIIQDKKKLREEKEMRRALANLESRKKRIAKKYRLSKEFINVINFLAILGNFRDARKSFNQMAGNTLRKFAEEFSRKSGLEINAVEYMFHWEMKNLFKLNKQRIREIESRPKGWLYFKTGLEKFSAMKGKQAERLNVFLKEQVGKYSGLSGMPAYAGIVEGKVKIIRDQNDFHKMKKGDILVAPNPRPEFLPVLKIAGAIISQEGGITCHAAIVSRELKTPCIVGVQGILSVIKDGDTIEVDAEKGLIRKL
ncbi:MAG: Phosphoenolpyruvate synthase/pyruvate phosphate dikinase [Candidatus Moranbacteria bacterium GW2011_GWC2_40_12]|nr:MAG: Phosphoenolpyruvate synthase/pyruvate phosphate dikinase [Candidatus Moranbacteria bacterium GW2011_GWC2_40_12]